jgi:hypothetical protein
MLFREDHVDSNIVSGTGLNLKMFYGSVLKNESDTSLIKTRYYQFERTLGSDADGVQAEYLRGAVSDELTLNIDTADQVTIDVSFMAADTEYRSGAEGLKVGTHYEAPGEDAFNTSNDVVRLRMSKVVPGDSYPDAYFGYVTKGTLMIKNNVSMVKAVSALGGIDVNVGNFEVGGAVTALFQNVAALKGIRANDDITIDMIFAKQHTGYVYDIPLLALGGGRLDIKENEPITMDLTQEAGKNDKGYTLLFTTFDYLPTLAMPVAV